MTHEYPLLPLDSWREIIGYSPWHFWGLADATIVPVTSKCNDIVQEYPWQGADQCGREDIRSAIANAEQLLFDHFGYWPAPVYSEATHPWPRYIDQRLERGGRHDARWRWIPVRLDEGQVRACGIEARTLIAAAAALTYSDPDGDGLSESWTCSAATTVTDPKEIAVYVPAAQRSPVNDPIGPKWRIEPVSVSIAAGTVTITGKRWLMVLPAKYSDANLAPIDPTVNANFLTSVSIYRRYTDMTGAVSSTNSQSALIWESKPCTWGCADCVTDGSTDPSSEGWVAGRCGIRDSENGIVIPAEATYDATTGTWVHPCECLDCCGEPDKVLVRYLAGKELDSVGQMVKPMRTLVARLAAAEMNRQICACDKANREWSYWQFDVTKVTGPETYQIGESILSNPLGTRRGHIYAWQQIQNLARAVGFLP